MTSDPEGIVAFKAGSKKYRLFFGMRAQKAAELHYDLPFFRVLQRAMPKLKPEDMADKAKVAEASADIRFTDIAKLFEFALLKHQPEITEDAVDNLIDDLGLTLTSEYLGQAISAAMVEEEGEGAGTNPPQAGQKRKTGSRALATG